MIQLDTLFSFKKIWDLVVLNTDYNLEYWALPIVSKCLLEHTLSYMQITLPFETQQLSKATRNTAAIYLACGIDISKVEKLIIDMWLLVLLFRALCVSNLRSSSLILWMQSSVFIQSHVRAHVELMWLLSSTTPIGWLYRMIQFKEKSRKAVWVVFNVFICDYKMF